MLPDYLQLKKALTGARAVVHPKFLAGRRFNRSYGRCPRRPKQASTSTKDTRRDVERRNLRGVQRADRRHGLETSPYPWIVLHPPGPGLRLREIR